jgi:hypothetical protein
MTDIQMNKLFGIILLGIILCCLSCNQDKGVRQGSRLIKTYVEFNNRGIEASIVDSLLPEKNWKEENVLDSMTIYYNSKPIIIRKISNYPDDPIDGGFVAYQVDSLGIFYLKTTTWRDFILMRTNNDSINNLIDILIGSILANSNMFLPPRQKEILDNKLIDTKQQNSH